MQRGLLLPLLAGLALAAPGTALAQEPPPEPVIAEGVTIAGTAVGGMMEEEAAAAVRVAFDQPLVLRLRGRTLALRPAKIDSRARVYQAVQSALGASAGQAVPLAVVLNKWKLRRWVKAVAANFDRAPTNSAVKLKRGRPWVTLSRAGRKLPRWPARKTIMSSFRRHVRGPVSLSTKNLSATVTRRNFGPVVKIRRGSKRLVLYRGMTRRGMTVRRVLGVATGMAAYPTPLGRFSIVSMQRNPWWYPPNAAADASPVPPGPGNPLGTRWMGLSAGGIGIHGTPDAASIGYSASHGCIRMRIADAEWLFERVRVGTPVFIVGR